MSHLRGDTAARPGERGHALVLSLLVLCLGGILVPAVLGIAHTGITTEQMYEGQMQELYAAGAGVENTIYKITTDDPALAALDETETYSYSLPADVDNLPVDVTATSITVLYGILGDDEYKTGDRPHQDDVQMALTYAPVETGGDYVVYSGTATVTHNGPGNKRVTGIGVYFYPPPDGGANDLSDPYDVTGAGEMAGSFDLADQEVKCVPGGFAFIWRFSDGPRLNNGESGSVNFTFKVDQVDWEPSDNFAWTTWQDQDISISYSGELTKWLISSEAGHTDIRAVVLVESGSPSILAWEVDPPG